MLTVRMVNVLSQAQQATLGTELLSVQKTWVAQQQQYEQVSCSKQRHTAQTRLVIICTSLLLFVVLVCSWFGG